MIPIFDFLGCAGKKNAITSLDIPMRLGAKRKRCQGL
jgi:hypothetical protein